MSTHSDRLQRSPVDKPMTMTEEAHTQQAEKSERKGANDPAVLDRASLGTMRTASPERSHGQSGGGSILPVVEEAGEAGSSTGGRSNGGSAVGNALDEKEKGRWGDGESRAGIGSIVGGEQALVMMNEKGDGGFGDKPVLAATMGKRPAGVVDLEKGLV
jgi:hypothetical protein